MQVLKVTSGTALEVTLKDFGEKTSLKRAAYLGLSFILDVRILLN